MAANEANRLELQDILEGICDHVYFSPPESMHLKYPCIVYERTNSMATFSDNMPYNVATRYTLTVIDEDPDSEILSKVEILPMCTHDRTFLTDNLNHDVYTLFYK